ncbi:DUF5722 domain-containing protein [Stieleria varia]|uniref:DUF5722 domain-containing protein n=1 Tax=Stieleria varia TaxID=2528005 RepID=UPI0018D20EF6|nr:DUF5722 domain-containing protein [Stieleria varia]
MPHHTAIARVVIAIMFVIAVLAQSTVNWHHASGAESPLALRPVGSLQLVASNHLTVTVTDDVITLVTTGSDPYLIMQMIPRVDGAEDQILACDYFCPTGISAIEFRIGPPFPHTSAALPAFSPAEGWTTWSANIGRLAPTAWDGSKTKQWRVDFGSEPEVQIQLRNVHVRALTPQEIESRDRYDALKKAKQDDAANLLDYVQRMMPARISRVIRVGDNIQVQGQVDEQELRNDTVAVVVRSPEQLASRAISKVELATAKRITPDDNGNFAIDVPVDGWPGSESACARFQLVRLSGDTADRAVSHCRYIEATALNSSNDLPEPPPLRSAKGLTCITSRFNADQLRDLGIRHCSVNVLLGGLVDDQPRPGYQRVELPSGKWYANVRRLSGLDHDVRMANEAGAVVAAILLIRNRSKGDESTLAHHEADPAGTYAMPDLTTDESIRRYRATLELLADRYARADNTYGRIDHWIVHNEVDYGWQWTNMGQQPMPLFMDHYISSLRLVDHCMRRVNPHARAFISLTHRWNVPDNQPWKTYAPREMLHHLIDRCRVEGDFPWGIAYHPYPESLWKSDTWNDRQVSDTLDTPLITIRNLPVLETFMQSDLARTSDGKVRPVLLSEQGFHAPMDDPEALQRQSAALLYTWQQMRKCPSILAFDYHRPSDHPNEGGLMLGLRGLPTPTNPLGEPKPAWSVYRDIATPRESDLMRQYKPFWSNANMDR